MPPRWVDVDVGVDISVYVDGDVDIGVDVNVGVVWTLVGQMHIPDLSFCSSLHKVKTDARPIIYSIKVRGWDQVGVYRVPV